MCIITWLLIVYLRECLHIIRLSSYCVINPIVETINTCIYAGEFLACTPDRPRDKADQELILNQWSALIFGAKALVGRRGANVALVDDTVVSRVADFVADDKHFGEIEVIRALAGIRDLSAPSGHDSRAFVLNVMSILRKCYCLDKLIEAECFFKHEDSQVSQMSHAVVARVNDKSFDFAVLQMLTICRLG